MAQVLPEVYDFRQHDRLWRRVQPGLEPYPEADTSGGNQAQTSDAGMTLAQESRLPGAEQNPCCMGTEAAELLTVLEGYIADELAERRLYLALAQRAPVWARQTMRELAEDEGDHARQLMTARYLITGQCRQPEALPLELVSAGDWCALLRQRYDSEVCGGMNYARTADSTPVSAPRNTAMRSGFGACWSGASGSGSAENINRESLRDSDGALSCGYFCAILHCNMKSNGGTDHVR